MGRTALFILILLSSGTFSQSQKKISTWIAELNNSQFIVDHHNKASFTYKSKVADKLIKHGARSKQQLVNALGDSSRVIMAQLILCHYWYKKATFAGPKMVTEGDAHVNKYFLGEENGEGLIISEKVNGPDHLLFVKPSDAEKIKEYWKKKFAY